LNALDASVLIIIGGGDSHHGRTGLSLNRPRLWQPWLTASWTASHSAIRRSAVRRIPAHRPCGGAL